MNRDFKGIWIPREIWVSTEISMQEKVFLAEIHSLDNEQGCIASNAYFADFFQLSKSSVTRIISSLAKKELIKVYLVYKDNKEVDKRIIRCLKYGGKEVKVVKNKDNKKENKSCPIINDVLIHLNLKAEKNFRNSYASSKFIVARYNEGHSLDDFKRVIDTKCCQWLNTDFDKFLRPSTLFNATKFQEYLAEKPVVKKEDVVGRIVESQKNFYDV